MWAIGVLPWDDPGLLQVTLTALPQIADVPETWQGSPLLAKSRLTRHRNGNRTLAHRDAGGRSRPPHQDRSCCDLSPVTMLDHF